MLDLARSPKKPTRGANKMRVVGGVHTRFAAFGAGAILLATLGLAGCSTDSSGSAPPSAQPSSGAVKTDTIQLAAIEPDDGVQPVLDFIKSAKKSVDYYIYEFDPTYKPMTRALIEAKDRGVTVRVLLSRQIYGEPNASNHNVKDRQTLLDMGIDTQLSRREFSYSHAKTFLVDAGTEQARAMITDFNVGKPYFEFVGDPKDGDPNEAGTRGMAVINTDPKDVANIAATFNADWPPYEPWPASDRPNLVWAPGSPAFTPTGNSITALEGLIGGARETLDVYVQALAVPSIMYEPLMNAVKNGVAVRIIGNVGGINSEAAVALAKAGANVLAAPEPAGQGGKHLYVHTKTLIADAGTEFAVAFIGSENPFLNESLRTERELGALVTDPASIAKMDEVFDRDFVTSKPYPAPTSAAASSSSSPSSSPSAAPSSPSN
jgi:cardiolipin synthase A/B